MYDVNMGTLFLSADAAIIEEIMIASAIPLPGIKAY